MSRLKQERAAKLLQDFYVIGSSIDTPTPLWHRRHHRWVTPDQRLLAAFHLFKHQWYVDLVTAFVEGDEAEMDVHTYKTDGPMLHSEVVNEFIEQHLAQTADRENVIAVGWVMRLDARPPNAELIAYLLGLA